MSESAIQILSGTVVVLGAAAGLTFGIPAYNRYQDLLNEENHVHINEIRIKQQEQLIKVETQKAQIRVEEAKGIAESQRIIAMSLSHNYLQYLAIKSQENLAAHANHSQIYIPVGNNGIPIIKTVDGD